MIFFTIIYIILATVGIEPQQKLLYILAIIAFMFILEGIVLRIKYANYILHCYKISVILNTVGIIFFFIFNYKYFIEKLGF